MKLLVMLAAIYALIINQSLKQKDENTRLKTDLGSEKQIIKHTNNALNNTVSGQEFTSLPVPAQNKNHKNKNLFPSLYKEQPSQAPGKTSDNGLQDLLYPVKFSYTPTNTAKERSR